MTRRKPNLHNIQVGTYVEVAEKHVYGGERGIVIQIVDHTEDGAFVRVEIDTSHEQLLLRPEQYYPIKRRS